MRRSKGKAPATNKRSTNIQQKAERDPKISGSHFSPNQSKRQSDVKRSGFSHYGKSSTELLALLGNCYCQDLQSLEKSSFRWSVKPRLLTASALRKHINGETTLAMRASRKASKVLFLDILQVD